MRQDILEKISFTIKQKIVDLQDDLSNMECGTLSDKIHTFQLYSQ